MTLGLYLLAAAIVLAVALMVVRRVRDSRRRQAVWICRAMESACLPADSPWRALAVLAIRYCGGAA